MARRSSLRASDADREQVAERLRKAAAEGRILAHELEERLATALRAQTYGELDAVTADLPGPRTGPRAAPVRARRIVVQQRPAATVAVLIAVTLVMFVLAALVLAGIMAFSGVWVLFALFWFSRGRGGQRRDRRSRHPGYRDLAGRW